MSYIDKEALIQEVAAEINGHDTLLCKLGERAVDEQDYENPQEYAQALSKALGAKYAVLNATFLAKGISFLVKTNDSVLDGEFRVVVIVRSNTVEVSIQYSKFLPHMMEQSKPSTRPDLNIAKMEELAAKLIAPPPVKPIVKPTVPKATAKPAKPAKKLYMAFNHNGTALMDSPDTFAKANAEVMFYNYQTGNKGYVEEV